MKDLAISRGGRCLSKTYVNTLTKLTWKCKLGHVWNSQPASIMNSKSKIGSWCPTCNTKGRKELLCRIIFEHIFNAPFTKIRPPWIPGLKGSPLELDGYNENLKIAFEYQGPHHYKNIPYFYASSKQLNNRLKDQILRDNIKRKKCKEFGVTLIEVPYISSASLEDFVQTVVDLCRRSYTKVPHIIDHNKIDLSSMWTPEALTKLEHARKIAKEKHGKLISKTYIGSDSPLIWKCKENHKWTSVIGKIQSGSWCPQCSFQRKKKTIQDAHTVAMLNNGACVSKRYTSSKAKMTWLCSNGHSWKASYEKIQSGRWCPICAQSKRGSTQRRNIEELIELAEQHGGKCLSSTYINVFHKMDWQCEKGHLWSATAKSVRDGSWCPRCLGKNKTILDAVQLAKSRNGKCLSKKYINNWSKLKWQCHLEHKWMADFSNIQSGKWCPKCALKKRGASQRSTIEDMYLLAKERNGLCLSKNYVNANTPLKWKCNNGHIWQATPGHVKNGTWCPQCFRNRRSLREQAS